MGRDIYRGTASLIRVALNEQAFAALVAGDMAIVRGVTADGTVTVEIILSDIGFAEMHQAIERAELDDGGTVVELLLDQHLRGPRGC